MNEAARVLFVFHDNVVFFMFFFYMITGELSKRAIHMCVSILSGIEDFVRERVWNFFENIRYDMEGREAYL